ncbi:MAG: 16S rRNA (uracil(1498)-N(3))-methyltransferase [Legionellales bacterium RIFCSPHIGHO2_12_FULL_35_11]|nr:MAG: 16S rRNA (uracil(1498)-N(3))-methyltransferase [Legionellales bacterium RIFCSPHIGHO2_12_FULL_35_11]
MRKIRIYQNGNFTPGQIIHLSDGASQHVARVLRMRTGDILTIFNGDNHEFTAEITQLSKKEAAVTIKNSSMINVESPFNIHLAQAIAKGDKMEMVIQKAVELGAKSISPIITNRLAYKLDGNKLQKKHQQWQAIAISACEQSGRNQLPEIKFPCNFAEYIQKSNALNKLILYPEAGKSWRDYKHISQEIEILIGPEGGLDNTEIELALANNYLPLSLGPRILRTETAALTAISILQAVFGDL